MSIPETDTLNHEELAAACWRNHGILGKPKWKQRKFPQNLYDKDVATEEKQGECRKKPGTAEQVSMVSAA